MLPKSLAEYPKGQQIQDILDQGGVNPTFRGPSQRMLCQQLLSSTEETPTQVPQWTAAAAVLHRKNGSHSDRQIPGPLTRHRLNSMQKATSNHAYYGR